MKIECHTGGAGGSDYAFAAICERHNTTYSIFTFLGHRGLTLPSPMDSALLYTYNDKELKLGHIPLLVANKTVLQNL